MCLSMVYYPLVKDEDDKQRILFNYSIVVDCRDTFEDMLFLQKNIKAAPAYISKYKSLNNLFYKEKFKELVKMVSLPCGKCSECLKQNSREWAFRIYLESLISDNCYFITLTYDDDNLPLDGFLIKDEISKFNKKLKTYLKRNNLASNFRFYGVGEYGSKFARPHYHVIYFNLPLFDLKYHSKTENGDILYTSDFLNKVWKKGYCIIGSVTLNSSCYVARYCDKKKRLSKEEKDYYLSLGIQPEFSVMSRNPGIGSYSFDLLKDRFKNGIFEYYINGQSYSVPVNWLKKIKNEVDSSILSIYEENSSLKSSVKINKLLEISDKCNLSSFLSKKDIVRTERKL